MSAKRVPMIDGVKFTEVERNSDFRGDFIKLMPSGDFLDALNSVAISFNPEVGTIRGIHFQIEPFAEEKSVSCVQGSVFDVIVDLRKESKTFGRWTSYELSAQNRLQIYLPRGVAHGFQTLTPNTILHYGLGASYSSQYSFAISPFGDLDIDWPMVTSKVSDRDVSGVTFQYAADKYSQSIGR
jgi:dTDP-4-dehydrorhamnose 3,5-epimerase